MRVMTSGPGFQQSNKAIMGFFFLYFFLHWTTGFFMFHTKLGFSYEGVVRYYLGDPDQFINPRSFAGLLEVSHFHLFAMGLFFVVFAHLLVFTPFRKPLKNGLTWGLAIALLSDMASGWLVRYADGSFAWLKLGSFWAVQGGSLMIMCGLVWALVLRADQHKKPRAKHANE